MDSNGLGARLSQYSQLNDSMSFRIGSGFHFQSHLFDGVWLRRFFLRFFLLDVYNTQERQTKPADQEWIGEFDVLIAEKSENVKISAKALQDDSESARIRDIQGERSGKRCIAIKR